MAASIGNCLDGNSFLIQQPLLDESAVIESGIEKSDEVELELDDKVLLSFDKEQEQSLILSQLSEVAPFFYFIKSFKTRIYTYLH
jgi:hypothetical protein